METQPIWYPGTPFPGWSHVSPPVPTAVTVTGGGLQEFPRFHDDADADAGAADEASPAK